MRQLLILCACLVGPSAGQAQEPAVWEGKTVRQWADQLTDADLRIRWYATYALGQIGPPAADAAEPLRKMLEDQARTEHEYVRVTAAWSLGRIGSADEATVSVLGKTLKSTLPAVRRGSAEALGRLGSAGKPAVNELLKALEDEDSVVRVNAAVALFRIQQDPKAVPALVELLRGGQDPAPYHAAVALGTLGADPEMVAPALAAALRSSDADVRRAATRSLGQIGGRAVLQELKKALGDTDDEVRRCAVETLGWMGPKVVPALVVTLKNENAAARRATARALERIGPEAKAAEAALVEAVNDPDQDVRDAAAKALRAVRGP